MPIPNKSFRLAALAAICLFGLVAYMWTRVESQQRQSANLRDQLERMTKRIDLLTEVVEGASARAVRAEENARAAADTRDKALAERTEAEKKSDEARAEAQTSAEQARAALAEAEKIRHQREQDLDRLQKALGALVETRRTALGLVMNLGENAIQFDFDRATLRPENRELLSRIAGVLLTAKGYSIYVYGHTDDIGSDEYNLDLSQRRARTVRDYLVEAGVDSSIITTRGYGKSSPRVPATTPEARAKNRRVEIGIVDVSLSFGSEAR
jgi:outer membrane protein OmpA-like peptidoglycan-associated protein